MSAVQEAARRPSKRFSGACRRSTRHRTPKKNIECVGSIDATDRRRHQVKGESKTPRWGIQHSGRHSGRQVGLHGTVAQASRTAVHALLRCRTRALLPQKFFCFLLETTLRLDDEIFLLYLLNGGLLPVREPPPGTRVLRKKTKRVSVRAARSDWWNPPEKNEDETRNKQDPQRQVGFT